MDKKPIILCGNCLRSYNTMQEAEKCSCPNLDRIKLEKSKICPHCKESFYRAIDKDHKINDFIWSVKKYCSMSCQYKFNRQKRRNS